MANLPCFFSLRRSISIPIENISMLREINLIYTQDFGHPELLHDIIRDYNETKTNPAARRA